MEGVEGGRGKETGKQGNREAAEKGGRGWEENALRRQSRAAVLLKHRSTSRGVSYLLPRVGFQVISADRAFKPALVLGIVEDTHARGGAGDRRPWRRWSWWRCRSANSVVVKVGTERQSRDNAFAAALEVVDRQGVVGCPTPGLVRVCILVRTAMPKEEREGGTGLAWSAAD